MLNPLRRARNEAKKAEKFAKKGARGVAKKTGNTDMTSRGIADGSLMPSGKPWVRASWASPAPKIQSNVPGHATPRVGLNPFAQKVKDYATNNPNSLVGPDGYLKADMVPASNPMNKVPKKK